MHFFNHLSADSSPKSAIVRLLQRRPLPLAELQARTGVSMPTLRRHVLELQESGWIRPTGQSSTGGRPARLYGLDGDSHVVIGVHLELPAMNLAAVALDGAFVAPIQRADNTWLSPDTAVRRITAFTHDMQQKFPARRILGVGVATPGFIDPSNGAILSVGRFDGWQQFPLHARLRASLSLPALIENDIDCMALAELSAKGAGALAAARDVLYLGFSEGVKAAMLLDGRLYRGPFGNAGVIGRTLVPDAHNGGARYLEEIASTGRVCAAFDQQVAAGKEDDARLQAIVAIPDRSAKFQAILDAAAGGEPLCRGVIVAALDVLALAAANLIHILQPGLLILGGALGALPPSLQPEFERRLRQRLSPLLSNHLQVRYGRLGDAQAAISGAASRFLQQYPIDQQENAHRV